ncbi:MAG: hypothetical protein ACREOW_15570 [Thermodesulfobacteriota bacterium]
MVVRDDYILEAASGINAISKEVRWKLRKDEEHLKKRKARGHLLEDTTLKDYNALISGLVSNNENNVYLYKFGLSRYYVISGKIENLEWIVIFRKNGVVETAFPPEDTESYIEKRGFLHIGKIREILK